MISPVTNEFKWPTDSQGKPKPTAFNPLLNIKMCFRCWNGDHPRDGNCKVSVCQCGCYKGRNKGLSSPHPPHKDCKENQLLPDTGSFEVR